MLRQSSKSLTSIVTLFIAAVLSLIPLASVEGHDFWLEPFPARVDPGDAVGVRLCLGAEFPGEVFFPDRAQVRKFLIVDGSGTRDVRIVRTGGFAGVLRTRNSGAAVVAYESAATSTVLTAEKFEAYLEEVGLEHISEMRRKRGESDKAGLESYSRSAKAILRVGGDSKTATESPSHEPPRDATWKLEAGLPLEITPLDDPFRATSDADRKMAFLVTFHGKPVEGVLVRARRHTEGDTEEPIRGRTDRDGRVVLSLLGTGRWLIAATWMVEAPEESDSDWQSTWASLTFELDR